MLYTGSNTSEERPFHAQKIKIVYEFSVIGNSLGLKKRIRYFITRSMRSIADLEQLSWPSQYEKQISNIIRYCMSRVLNPGSLIDNFIVIGEYQRFDLH